MRFYHYLLAAALIVLGPYACQVRAQAPIGAYQIKFWRIDVPTTPPTTFFYGDTMKFAFEDGDSNTPWLPDPPVINPILDTRSITFLNDAALWTNGTAQVKMESVQLPAGKWVVAIRAMSQGYVSAWSEYIEIQVLDRINVPKMLRIVIE